MKYRRCTALFLFLCLLLMLVTMPTGCSRGQECTISFDANYEDGLRPAPITTEVGLFLTLPEPLARPGYDFLGWFREPTLLTPWNAETDRTESDITLYAGWDKATGDEIAEDIRDKDFSGLRTPEYQEADYQYQAFFRPAADQGAGTGTSLQPYVGDVMPFYENGILYLYYIKEGGDSYHHSIYMVTTRDFVHYTEYDEPVLEVPHSGGQDGWFGAGSVLKSGDRYLLFYTQRTYTSASEFTEVVQVAEGETPLAFEPVAKWQLARPESLEEPKEEPPEPEESAEAEDLEAPDDSGDQFPADTDADQEQPDPDAQQSHEGTEEPANPGDQPEELPPEEEVWVEDGSSQIFQHPQAFVDTETGETCLLASAVHEGVPRILLFTLDEDLKPQGDPIWSTFYVCPESCTALENPGLFTQGGRWYLTWTDGDGSLWGALGQTQFGPFEDPTQWDGPLFCGAKPVSVNGTTCMAGWVRRSESPSDAEVSAWGGNLGLLQVQQTEDGNVTLAPADRVLFGYRVRHSLATESTHLWVEPGAVADEAAQEKQKEAEVLGMDGEIAYADLCTCLESYVITGEFRYSGTGGTIGLAFPFGGKDSREKRIALDLEAGTLELQFHAGRTVIAQVPLETELVPGRDYSFTYLQEGSVGIFTLDGVATLTVRIYGVSGKTVQLYVQGGDGVLFSSLRQYVRQK